MFLSRSTAQKTREALLKTGLTIDEFDSNKLSDLYATLQPTKDQATFNEIIGIFANIPIVSQAAQDPCLGVIIETREHPLLEKVVMEFIENTANRVQIFHGKLNQQFILSSKISAAISSGQVTLSPLNTDNIVGRHYNAILLSMAFWDSLIARNKIFIFQTDSQLCANSNYQLTDFIHYDYIGSWWPRYRPVNAVIDGGNGGLSIRDWHRSRTCLKRFSAKLWPGGEDSYFAFHIDLINGKVARDRECSKFSTQYKFRHKSFGCHNISQLSQSEKQTFIQYCPESKSLL